MLQVRALSQPAQLFLLSLIFGQVRVWAVCSLRSLACVCMSMLKCSLTFLYVFIILVPAGHPALLQHRHRGAALQRG
jgi:hypothetical protein